MSQEEKKVIIRKGESWVVKRGQLSVPKGDILEIEGTLVVEPETDVEKFERMFGVEVVVTEDSRKPHTAYAKPHTAYAKQVKPTGRLRREAWNQLRELAMKSKGKEQIELPGYGLIYLKPDRKDMKRTIRYKLTPFEFPDDGELFTRKQFDDVCPARVLARWRTKA